MEEKIKEVKIEEEGGPHLKCPYCGAKYCGWVLVEKRGEIDGCDKCGRKFRIV